MLVRSGDRFLGKIESSRREALNWLCECYWYPIYAFLRRHGHTPAAAQDLTQSFLVHFLERKSIERAKGLLMEREGLSEQEAFARLRKASQVSGRPLRVVADAVVATLAAD